MTIQDPTVSPRRGEFAQPNVPSGLIAAIVSPLNENGGIDHEDLEGIIGRVAAQSGCILVNGIYAGEGLFLPERARKELIRGAAEIIGGKKQLMVGVTGGSADETVSNIRFVETELERLAYPGDVFLVDAPLCYRGNRGLRAHYLELADISTLPFILSNHPKVVAELNVRFRRHNIRTNVLKKLSHNIRIVGIEHNGEPARSLNYMKALRQRQDFAFYDANELNFLDCPASGGVVSSGANVLPEEWRLIVDSSYGADEKLKEEESYRRSIMGIRQKLKELHECCRASPAALLKYALKCIGAIKSDRVCAPSHVNSDDRKRIHLFLESTGKN